MRIELLRLTLVLCAHWMCKVGNIVIPSSLVTRHPMLHNGPSSANYSGFGLELGTLLDIMDLYTCTSIVGAYGIPDNTKNVLKCNIYIYL